MGFFRNFPYTNFHEMNLDWLLEEMEKLKLYVEQYTAINKVEYGGIWDISKQYPLWAIVSNVDSTYLSKKVVPVGVDIANEEYWIKIADLDPRIVTIIEEINEIKSVYKIDGETGVIGSVEKWLENLHRKYSENITELDVKSENGNYGGVFASRTSDNDNDIAMSAIGVGGFGIADNITKPKPSWGGYFEGRRIGNGNNAFGVEIDVSSIGSETAEMNPYKLWNNYTSEGVAVGLNLSSGLGYEDGSSEYPYHGKTNYGASCAIAIHKNPKKFKKGIIFETECVEDGNAICLPWTGRIAWWRGDSLESFLNQTELRLSDYSDDFFPRATFKRRGLNGDTIDGVIGRWVADSGHSDELFIDMRRAGGRGRVVFGISGLDITFDKDYIIPENASPPTLGTGSNPFATVYVNTAPVVVSDKRLKKEIADISDAEKEAINSISIKKYVGFDRKIHFGVLAQDIIEAFEKVGLSAFDYGIIETWKNENGEDFYSVRYDELYALKFSTL